MVKLIHFFAILYIFKRTVKENDDETMGQTISVFKYICILIPIVAG